MEIKNNYCKLILARKKKLVKLADSYTLNVICLPHENAATRHAVAILHKTQNILHVKPNGEKLLNKFRCAKTKIFILQGFNVAFMRKGLLVQLYLHVLYH